MDKNIIKNQKISRKNPGKLKATGKKAIRSDVQGSYTGVPTQPFERPVQDADDL